MNHADFVYHQTLQFALLLIETSKKCSQSGRCGGAGSGGERPGSGG